MVDIEAYASDDGYRRSLRFSLLVYALTAVVMTADVVADVMAASTPAHVALEIVLMLLALAGLAWFFRHWRAERALAAEAQRSLAAARQESVRFRAEALRWREEAREALEGLGRALDVQFERWQLTPAEREVALLLLKGLSHKEIAAAREVSERTARQQARAVYAKADVSGRAELSAFFLEDLLAPAAARGGELAAGSGA